MTEMKFAEALLLANSCSSLADLDRCSRETRFIPEFAVPSRGLSGLYKIPQHVHFEQRSNSHYHMLTTFRIVVEKNMGTLLRTNL